MSSAKDRRLSRRGFLVVFRRLLEASGLAILIGPIVAYFWPGALDEVPPRPVVVGPQGSAPSGGPRTVRFGRYPALVIHTETEGLVAYSAVCSHFACIVK